MRMPKQFEGVSRNLGATQGVDSNSGLVPHWGILDILAPIGKAAQGALGALLQG